MDGHDAPDREKWTAIAAIVVLMVVVILAVFLWAFRVVPIGFAVVPPLLLGFDYLLEAVFLWAFRVVPIGFAVVRPLLLGFDYQESILFDPAFASAAAGARLRRFPVRVLFCEFAFRQNRGDA